MIVFESTVQLLENWKYNPHDDPSSTLFLNVKLFAFIAYTKAFEYVAELFAPPVMVKPLIITLSALTMYNVARFPIAYPPSAVALVIISGVFAFEGLSYPTKLAPLPFMVMLLLT